MWREHQAMPDGRAGVDPDRIQKIHHAEGQDRRAPGSYARHWGGGRLA